MDYIAVKGVYNVDDLLVFLTSFACCGDYPSPILTDVDIHENFAS
jgi:hypothetical protein